MGVLLRQKWLVQSLNPGLTSQPGHLTMGKSVIGNECRTQVPWGLPLCSIHHSLSCTYCQHTLGAPWIFIESKKQHCNVESDQESGLNLPTRTQAGAVCSASCEQASPLLLTASPLRSSESCYFLKQVKEHTPLPRLLISTRRNHHLL